MMASFERHEVVRLLEVDDEFLETLESESIIHFDAEGHRFSERMVERIRVAHTLVFELEVNLSGVAVILRMREELGSVQGTLNRLHAVLRNQAGSSDFHEG
jgi:hypothetical protein